MPLRSTIVGAASGVVLLAGVVGFAVGLPEIVDDESEAQAQDSETAVASGTPAADLLPDELLDGALVRFHDLDPKFSEMFDEVESYGGEKLTDAFGVDTAVAIYTTPRQDATVALTIYDGESGLFLQTGPPVPPAMTANSQTTGEVVKQGESVCFAQWQTQAKAQDAPPFQVQCQRVVAGRTINVYAAPGLTVEQTADIVDDVAAQGGLE
jgi:hypothetical protein